MAVTVGSVVRVTNCLLNKFSETFNISSLPSGAENISVSTTDIAGNVKTVSSSFERIFCSNFQNTVNNECEFKEIENASFNITTTLTKLDSFSSNYSATHAQEIELYKDGSCADLAETINYTSSFTQINEYVADGVVSKSVKFVNGDKKTNCLSDSFVVDKTAPEISFTPVADSVILTDIFSISGVCKDTNGIDSLSIKNNKTGIEHSVSCSNESFTTNSNISSISALTGENIFDFDLTAIDNAGNSKTITSSSFEKRKTITITVTNANPLYGKILDSQNSFSCDSALCSFSILNNSNISFDYSLLFNGKFTNWGGACVVSGSKCEVSNIQDNITLSVAFEPLIYLESRPDTGNVQQDQVLYLRVDDLMANDKSLVGRSFSIISVSDAIGGTVSLSNGTITFDPNVLTGEPASFKYTLRDSAGVTATGDVTVTVDPLPQSQALIYPEESISDLILTPPPTLSEIFSSWGRFEQATTLSRYFENQAAAQAFSGTTETLSWSFNASQNYISSTTNSTNFIGFVSPGSYENYELELNIQSTAADDDAIIIIIAFLRENGVNKSLTLVRSAGGFTVPSSGYGAVLNYNVAGFSTVLDHKQIGNGNNTWNGKYVKLFIQRTGDIIKMFTSNYNSNTLDPASLITIDLNSSPELAKFKGPKPYGYGAHSQQNSKFYNIRFKSNTDLDPYFIYDFENLVVYEYINGVGWSIKSVDFAEHLGYPREVYNPRTQKTYSIDKDKNVTEILP